MGAIWLHLWVFPVDSSHHIRSHLKIPRSFAPFTIVMAIIESSANATVAEILELCLPGIYFERMPSELIYLKSSNFYRAPTTWWRTWILLTSFFSFFPQWIYLACDSRFQRASIFVMSITWLLGANELLLIYFFQLFLLCQLHPIILPCSFSSTCFLLHSLPVIIL